jgi:two-component system response regulator YesN
MIDVLIAEDDQMVRKGLVLSMPWEKFGMRVVGDVKNGEKALEFLRHNHADLLVTDLAMPVMSGIELMRIVRERYPNLFIVVLTVHQDFEYVQEALRLGAIDYIAKVELEQQSFDRVLERIRERIVKEREKSGGIGSKSLDDMLSDNDGYSLMLVDEDPDAERQAELWVQARNGYRLDAGLWFWCDQPASGNPRDALTPPADNGWAIIRLRDLKGQSFRRVFHWLREYREHGLFYDYAPGVAMLDKSLTQPAGTAAPAEEEISRAREEWLVLGWMFQPAQFEELLNQLQAWRLPPVKLHRFLEGLASEWNRILGSVIFRPVELKETFKCWQEVRQWLHATREILLRETGHEQYSEEVRASIFRSLELIRNRMAFQVSAAEIAREVNMSRSYYCQCFKDLIGMTFHDYLRQARLEKAKEYLKYTNRTINWIAEHTGYSDEKYFSRLFREMTGMLPSEFRQKAQEDIHRTAPPG